MSRRDARRAEWRDRIRSRAANPRSISVHIDELRVVGFPANASRRIADGLQQELHALTAARGLPPQWMHTRTIDSASGGRVAVHSGMNPHGIGAQVARAVLDIRVRERR